MKVEVFGWVPPFVMLELPGHVDGDAPLVVRSSGRDLARLFPGSPPELLIEAYTRRWPLELSGGRLTRTTLHWAEASYEAPEQLAAEYQVEGIPRTRSAAVRDLGHLGSKLSDALSVRLARILSEWVAQRSCIRVGCTRTLPSTYELCSDHLAERREQVLKGVDHSRVSDAEHEATERGLFWERIPPWSPRWAGPSESYSSEPCVVCGGTLYTYWSVPIPSMTIERVRCNGCARLYGNRPAAMSKRPTAQDLTQLLQKYWVGRSFVTESGSISPAPLSVSDPLPWPVCRVNAVPTPVLDENFKEFGEFETTEAPADEKPTASPTADQLRAEYSRSIVEVMTNGRAFVAPSGNTPDWPWVDPVWVVTAHNPGGVPCSDAWNRRAGKALESEAAMLQLSVLNAVGKAADGSWSEPGIALVYAEQRQALRLAHRFGQLALFKLEDGELDVVETGIEFPSPHHWAAGPIWSHGEGVAMMSFTPCANCGRDSDWHHWDDLDLDGEPMCPDDSGRHFEYPVGDDETSLAACVMCEHGLRYHTAGACEMCFCQGFYAGPDCAACSREPIDHRDLIEDFQGVEDFQEAEDFDWDEAECDAYVFPQDTVFLNSASAEELMSLPGIGRVSAMQVISHRPFLSLGQAHQANIRGMPKAYATGRLWL